MKVINDGKIEIFRIKLLKFILEFQIFLTDDCSFRLSNYGRLIFTFWKADKMKWQKTVKFQLKYKFIE